MMQCLQSQSSVGAIGTNWNQAPGGRAVSFIPNWKANNPNSLNRDNAANKDWSRPGLNHNPNSNPKYGPDDWRKRDRLNNPNINPNTNPNGYGPGGQPQPGVHPDDWGKINVGPSETSWTRRGMPAEPPPGTRIEMK